MGGKKFCVICGKDVEIVKVITHGNYEEQILSCDHIGGRLNLSRSDYRLLTKKCNQAATIAIRLASPIAAVAALIVLRVSYISIFIFQVSCFVY